MMEEACEGFASLLRREEGIPRVVTDEERTWDGVKGTVKENMTCGEKVGYSGHRVNGTVTMTFIIRGGAESLGVISCEGVTYTKLKDHTAKVTEM